MANIKTVNVVGAVIYDKDIDKYLVTMRGKNKMMGGLWEFPGGKVELGETYEDALRREIREELNCYIEVDRFIEDYTYNYPEITVRLITYLCRIISGTPQLSEHENMMWVTREEMKKLKFPEADIPTVNKLVGGLD